MKSASKTCESQIPLSPLLLALVIADPAGRHSEDEVFAKPATPLRP